MAYISYSMKHYNHTLKSMIYSLQHLVLHRFGSRHDRKVYFDSEESRELGNLTSIQVFSICNSQKNLFERTIENMESILWIKLTSSRF